MKFKPLVLAASAVAAALIATGYSSAQMDVVKERQDLMRVQGKSFGPLVAVLKGESSDLAAAAAAAQAMHDAAVKAATLFPAGTAKGEAEGSRAKPEVWSDSAEFKAASDKLAEETMKLVTAANSGDVDAFKAQFQMAAQACGGCHEGKGSAGGKFRFPKDS